MKKLMTLLMALVFTVPNLFGQGTVTLGTGTATNGTTAHPTPYGTYYKNHRVQYLILASELTSLGVIAGDITALGFEVANVNNCSEMPNYTMKVKLTTASVLTTTFDNEGYTTVWTHPNFLPVVGWNTHTFTNPFVWDGTSNFLIDVCFDIIPGNFTQNASVFFTPTPTNLSNSYRSDAVVACGTTNAATLSPNRANMQITANLASCIPPSNLQATSPTTSSVVLSWVPVGTETLWNLKYGEPGFDPVTEGALVSGITAIPYTLEGLTPITNYQFYVQADCGGGDLSNWGGPGSFLTTSDPLSGAYTINSAMPSAGTNFNNFTDFANAINLGGFAGPVTVDVVAGSGPYTEQITLGELPNSSEVNTLTIIGNGQVLQFLSTNTNERHTLRLNGTDYVTVDNLTIVAQGAVTGEFGWAVWLSNGADYNTFINCQFIADQASTLSNFNAFVTSNSATLPTSAGVIASYLTIQNCEAIGGFYGIVVNGPTIASNDPAAQGNNVSNNLIRDFHSYGLYLRGQNNGVFTENIINRTNRTTTGIAYMLYITQNMSNSVVTKNRVYDFAGTVASTSTANGIYGTGIDATAGEELLIANNLVYGFQNMNGAQYGLYLLSTNNTRVYHNTVSLDHAGHTGATSIIRAFHHSGNLAVIDIRNNIFSVTSNSGGVKYCMYFSQTGANLPVVTTNNNVLFMGATAGTNHIGYWNGTSYTTLPDWQAVPDQAFDLNSVDADPMFEDPASGNFVPLSLSVLDIGANLLDWVPDDINGTPRSTTPDPGAFEGGDLPPEECEYTVELYDDYGDGWNGGLLTVLVDGEIVLDGITLLSGYGPAIFTFPVTTDALIVFDYTAGSWAYENEYFVYNALGELVFSDGVGGVAPVGGQITGDCSLPTCAKPTQLTATNLMPNSADLGWTPGGEETSWNIEWGLAGFEMGTGTLIENVTDNPYTLGGLDANTAYAFYVQAICGDFVSDWAGPRLFNTPCDVFTVFPWIEDFEGDFPPDCFIMTGGTRNWAQFTTTEPANSSARANFWGWTAGNDALMTTPIFDISSLESPMLAFKWSHLYSTTYPLDELDVLITNDFGLTWVSIWNKSGEDFNSNDGAGNTTPGSFVEELVDISAFNTKGTVQIRFHAISGYGPDLFVDDIRVFESTFVLLPGDANGDGFVDVLDVVAIAMYIVDMNPEPFVFENADVNGDGVINISDLIATVNITLGGDLKSLYTGLNSATAHIYLNNNGIVLESDGTLSGLQFEINGMDVSQLEFLLPGFEFMTNTRDNKVFGLIFSLGNNPIPAGKINLFNINGRSNDANWGEVTAANLVANEVKVMKHVAPVGELSLSAYPNPSNGNVTAVLDLPESSMAVIRIIDVMGREVHMLHNGNLAAGQHNFNADLTNQLRKGIYFLQLDAIAESTSVVVSKQLKLIVIE